QDLSTLGFECTLEEVDPEDITENQLNTIKACTSEDAEVKSISIYLKLKLQPHIFMEEPYNPHLHEITIKCLQGIYEDLRAYRAELKNLNDPKVLATIDEMMKVRIS
ncbi:IL12A protein, partial [Atrichornis clamosus]|nr:IL12A protein [Atrichornis clamosus]